MSARDRPQNPKSPPRRRTPEEVALEAFRNRLAEGDGPERDAAPDRLPGG